MQFNWGELIWPNLGEKMEIVDCYMTKPKYSYKKATFSFFG